MLHLPRRPRLLNSAALTVGLKLVTGLLMACLPMVTKPIFGQTFPKIYNSETDTAAQPISPTEAAKGFDVPAGFKVSVLASEPDVQNPIAMTWDAKGRLWVAENFTYAERSQRFDLSLRDRVLIFEDTNQDGVADKRTVFTDQVQMLTSVEVGHGGVWLMCPSRLLFFPDRNGDDQPDGPAITVLDGFDVAKDNYHNFANGLKWGPDGWLYGRCGGSCPGRIGIPGTPDRQRVALEGGIWRYHPRTRHFEVLSHGTTNPWGHDWNEFGDGFFINTVNGHLWHLIPGAHYHRPFTLDPNPHVYQLIDMHADHWHFDTTGQWHQSRDGAANDFGGGHAHCGMSIYQGGHWPAEYHGRLFTLNFHGRRANSEILVRSGSGYVAKHGKDILTAADPFFRGMEISYGPDGNMVVLDWSDTGECHEATGVHRTSGRIFKVTHQRQNTTPSPPPETVDLRSLPAVKWVQLMHHPNEWFVRQARVLLSDRATVAGRCDDEPVGGLVDHGHAKLNAQPDSKLTSDLDTAIDRLKRLTDDASPQVAYRALVTLGAMGCNDQELLRARLSHPDPHLRAWAIRLITDHWPIDDVFGPNDASRQRAASVQSAYDDWEKNFCELARADPSGLVRLALASTIQRLPVDRRCPLATALMSSKQYADDHNLPLLVWYGLIPVAQSDPMSLAKVAIGSRWPMTQRLIVRRLVQDIKTAPHAIDTILTFAASASVEVQMNLLQGLSDGLKGYRRVRQPATWNAVVAAAQQRSDQQLSAIVSELSVLFGDGRAIEQVRNLVLDPSTDISIRRTALEALVAGKPDGMVEICLPLLRNPKINVTALRGVTGSEDPKIAQSLVQNYSRFRSPYRPLVIEALASRTSWADRLLSAIQSGTIPLEDLTAFDVRQIKSLGDEGLAKRVTEIWGEVRDTPAAKRRRIDELKTMLTASSPAGPLRSPSRGRLLFNTHCAKCHRLFGQGESIGPELTGADRTNMDYLLENIVDPSAVVSKNYRMSIVATSDGQVFNGLITAKTEATLGLQTQNELKIILTQDVEAVKQSALSPMPDGILDGLTDVQIADLFSYLKQAAQVPLPDEEISPSLK